MPLSLVGGVHESLILVANPIPVKASTMLGTAEEKGRSNIDQGLDLFDAQCCMWLVALLCHNRKETCGCVHVSTCVMHKHTHMCTIMLQYTDCIHRAGFYHNSSKNLSRLVNCEIHSWGSHTCHQACTVECRDTTTPNFQRHSIPLMEESPVKRRSRNLWAVMLQLLFMKWMYSQFHSRHVQILCKMLPLMHTPSCL